MKITSDRQMHMYLSLVGKACISEKSCSCMAVEKSRSMWVKFGHLFANSWRTVWVINSIGNSMYLSEAPKRVLLPEKVILIFYGCVNPPYRYRLRVVFWQVKKTLILAWTSDANVTCQRYIEKVSTTWSSAADCPKNSRAVHWFPVAEIRVSIIACRTRFAAIFCTHVLPCIFRDETDNWRRLATPCLAVFLSSKKIERTIILSTRRVKRFDGCLELKEQTRVDVFRHIFGKVDHLLSQRSDF